MIRRSLFIALVLVSALSLTAGALSPAIAEIKIGVLLPLSGKASQYGITQEVGMRMAEAELEKLKIKGEAVKLIVYDTRGDNAEAINLTRKLIHSDKVLLVLGPFFSAECEVAFPIANQGKTPIITAAAISTRLRPSTLDTNGKLREARRLHSITATSLPLARNWMLNGPWIASSAAMAAEMRRMRRTVSR